MTPSGLTDQAAADREVTGREPVLVGTDGSGPAALAVSWAAEEARVRDIGLHVVTVSEPGGPQSPGTVLQRARTLARIAAPELAVVADRAEGRPTDVLAGLAARSELTVVGHRGFGGLPSVALGSTATRLCRLSTRPVVVIRAAPGRPVPDRDRPIVVGVDGHVGGRAALRFAAALALRRSAALHVVHVWTEHAGDVLRRLGRRARRPARETAAQLLDDELACVHGRPGLDLRASVVRGRPSWALLELSDSAQLVVLGRSRRLRTHGLTLVQASSCPVAVVPAEERDSCPPRP